MVIKSKWTPTCQIHNCHLINHDQKMIRLLTDYLTIDGELQTTSIAQWLSEDCIVFMKSGDKLKIHATI